MQIDVEMRSVYGTERVYITDPKLKKHFQILTGQLTLSAQHINALSALGHTFEVETPKLEDLR